MPRPLLPAILLAAAFLAGCAQTEAPGADVDLPQAASAEEAATLFAQAVANMPDRFAVRLQADRAGEALMTGEALLDDAARTAYFSAELSDGIAELMAQTSPAGMLGEDLGRVAVYATPDASVARIGQRALVTAEGGTYRESVRQQDGIGTLADPAALLGAMSEGGLEITSVTADTVRDHPALKVEASYAQDGVRVPATAWLTQDPIRIARLTTSAPSAGGPVDPLAGAVMTLDLLYDDEIDVAVPTALTRALGLRFDSNAGSGPFSDRSDDAEGSSPPEEVTWTFAVDGGIPLADVTLELDGEPLLVLSALTAERDDVTATFDDADADGMVSAGDTLRIRGAEQSQLALHDTLTGLRVVPGAGLLLVALGLAGAAGTLRRR